MFILINKQRFEGCNVGKAKFTNLRGFSVLGFSFLSAHILSFQFEGQVLYGLLSVFKTEAPSYILGAISAHCLGLFTCGFFVKS